MARVVEECTNASFCCSGALREEEFLSAVGALERRHVGTFGSGVQEIRGVLSRLGRAGAVPTWALANRRILSKRQYEVWALAPADGAFTHFLRQIGRLIPKAGQKERRIRSLSPNDVAVVLWIAVGDIAVLLGSDMEQRGWSAIVEDAARPAGKASVFKVPHHGSKSAHEPRVWETMLEPEPVAVITPWRRGGRVVPNRQDCRRILDRTANAHVTASVDSTAPVRRRAHMVERVVRESGIRIRQTPTPDAVRLRRRIGSGARWRVERLGSACHLEDFAV